MLLCFNGVGAIVGAKKSGICMGGSFLFEIFVHKEALMATMDTIRILHMNSARNTVQ